MRYSLVSVSTAFLFFFVTAVTACELSTVAQCSNSQGIPQEICSRVLSGLVGEQAACSDDLTYSDRDKAIFLQIDQLEDEHGGYMATTLQIVAPSEQLSGAFGPRVYEQHIIDLLLFRNFSGENSFAVVSRDSRFLKGRKTLAFDFGNPNWVDFNDSVGGGSVQFVLQKTRRWICPEAC